MTVPEPQFEQNPTDEPRLPPRLAQDLGRLYSSQGLGVPGEFDAVVLVEARRAMTGGAKAAAPRVVVYRWMKISASVAAAAAVVAVTVTAVFWRPTPKAPAVAMGTAARELGAGAGGDLSGRAMFDEKASRPGNSGEGGVAEGLEGASAAAPAIAGAPAPAPASASAPASAPAGRLAAAAPARSAGGASKAKQPAADLGLDLNGDGRVDIRDAMLLAQQIADARAAGVAGPRDLTTGRLLDQSDVDALAQRAVSLALNVPGGGVRGEP
jgi:hypothetical protein